MKNLVVTIASILAFTFNAKSQNEKQIEDSKPTTEQTSKVSAKSCSPMSITAKGLTGKKVELKLNQDALNYLNSPQPSSPKIRIYYKIYNSNSWKMQLLPASQVNTITLNIGTSGTYYFYMAVPKPNVDCTTLQNPNSLSCIDCVSQMRNTVNPSSFYIQIPN